MSTQLIKPNYLVILPPTQHHSFFRNLPPLFAYKICLPHLLVTSFLRGAPLLRKILDPPLGSALCIILYMGFTVTLNFGKFKEAPLAPCTELYMPIEESTATSCKVLGSVVSSPSLSINFEKKKKTKKFSPLFPIG